MRAERLAQLEMLHSAMPGGEAVLTGTGVDRFSAILVDRLCVRHLIITGVVSAITATT